MPLTHRWRRAPWETFPPFVLLILHALLFRSWLVDDAGISFAYARNFAHGYGLVSQPGVERVEGFSNPLWTLLVAPLFVYDPADPTLAVKSLSLMLLLGTFITVGLIFRRLFGESGTARAASASALSCLALNTSFVTWTTSGLENPLYVFLAAVYVLLQVRYAALADRTACSCREVSGRHLAGKDDSSSGARARRMAALSGLTAAGLALTRPDGLVFAAAFPAVIVLRAAADRLARGAENTATGQTLIRSAACDVLVFLAAWALPLAAYAGFRAAYFGGVYPNTYYAKGGPTARDVLRLTFLAESQTLKTHDLLWGMFTWRTVPVLLALLAAGFFVLFRPDTRRCVLLLVPTLACSWAAYGLLPEDWMGEYRFATPFFVVFYTVFFALAAAVAEAVLPSEKTAKSRVALLFALGAAMLGQSAAVYVPRSLRFAENPTVPLARIARDVGVAFNTYARVLGTGEASLLCPDVGGTLCSSRLRVHDLGGLCDRRLAELVRAGDNGPLHDYVFGELRPTFIHVHDAWSLACGFHTDSRFAQDYAAIWEAPSAWAAQRGHADVLSGDYVRKDAVAPDRNLDRLRETMRRTGGRPASTDEDARPFPRG